MTLGNSFHSSGPLSSIRLEESNKMVKWEGTWKIVRYCTSRGNSFCYIVIILSVGLENVKKDGKILGSQEVNWRLHQP